MSIAPTAVLPPATSIELVRRSSLDRFLPEIANARVTTVSGPAGSGKTSAMLQWADAFRESGRPVLWLSTRAGLADIGSFTHALKLAGARAGLPWHSVAPRQDAVAWVALLMAAEDLRPVMFVDDAHLLGDEVLNFLATLIGSARDTATLVLGSRGRLRIPLARLRSLGRLVEVEDSDLTLPRDEAAEIVVRRVGGPVEANALQRILSETNGWSAGIVTASNLYRRERSRGVRSPELSGLWGEIAAYFEEEVLAAQPKEVRQFLIDTSILDRLTPAACAAVMDDDSAEELLASVVSEGIFVQPFEQAQSCYVHHPLFRRFLLERAAVALGTKHAELHRRASQFFVTVGEELRAVEHASASGDETFLADQLDQLGEELTYKGYLFRVAELGGGLPWQLLSVRPMLLLLLAWRRIRNLGFASAERLIAAATACRARGIDDGSLTPFEAERLQHHIRHRHVMLSSAQDHMSDVERDAGALLAELGDDYPYLSCTLLAQLMSARRELYHFHDMLKLEAETQRALGRPGSDFASIALKASIAPTLMVQGKTALTTRMLREALAKAESLPGASAAIAPLPALPLAELLYDLNELEEAHSLVEQHLFAVRQWGFVDQLASGYLTRARLAFARGDVAAALAGLQEAHVVALECGLDRLRAFVVAEQVRMLVKSGQLEEAEAAFRAGDLNPDQEPIPTLNPTRRHESIAVAWLRIEIQRHRLARARKIARRWLEFVRRSGAIRSAVVFELLLAEIAVLQGNRTEAKRAVRAAAELAEPGGWLRMFIDEGEVIATLLANSYGTSPAPDSPVDRFAERLLALTRSGAAATPGDGNEEEASLTGQLAGREIDVLMMVHAGLLNREIGDRLGMTEGTVKWYMQQIYDKLGMRRRQQAVIRARQLGVLP